MKGICDGFKDLLLGNVNERSERTFPPQTSASERSEGAKCRMRKEGTEKIEL